MTSNFNDKGWSFTAPSTNTYGPNTSASNTSNTNQLSGLVTVAPEDVYDAMNRPGVYILNGDSGLGFDYYEIPYSVSALGNLSAIADAFLVYPGFGFTAYNQANYSVPSGGTSRTYHNNTDKPVIFYFTGTGTWSNPTSTIIIDTSGANVTTGTTRSIKVYYRGALVVSDVNVSGNP